MQSGKITNVQSTMLRTGSEGYQSQNGYIFTFDITIQFPEGQVTGEIGSKSQQYPLTAGQDISVETKNDQHGTKFKKINPQYAGQAGGSQNRPQSTTAQGGNNVQDDIRFAQGLNLAVSEYAHGKCDEPSIEGRTKMYYQILKTRIFPATLSATSPIFEQHPSSDEENIPF